VVAAGEDGEFVAAREAFETGDGQQPLFTVDETFCIFIAPVEFLEFFLDLLEGYRETELIDPGGAELPVVVETRAIFPGVKLAGGDAFFGEVADGFERGALK
jgi:hypothetical protein